MSDVHDDRPEPTANKRTADHIAAKTTLGPALRAASDGCTLSKEDAEGQVARVEQLRPAVRRIERRRGRLAIEFAPDADRALIGRLVELERECGRPAFQIDFVDAAVGPEIRYAAEDPALDPVLADLARVYDAAPPAPAPVSPCC